MVGSDAVCVYNCSLNLGLCPYRTFPDRKMLAGRWGALGQSACSESKNMPVLISSVDKLTEDWFHVTTSLLNSHKWAFLSQLWQVPDCQNSDPAKTNFSSIFLVPCVTGDEWRPNCLSEKKRPWPHQRFSKKLRYFQLRARGAAVQKRQSARRFIGISMQPSSLRITEKRRWHTKKPLCRP